MDEALSRFESLIVSKRKANRPQDIQDVEYLEALAKGET